MNAQIEAIQPADEASKIDQTEELKTVPASDNDADLFLQKTFESNEVSMQQTNMQALKAVDEAQMGTITKDISAAQKLIDRDD